MDSSWWWRRRFVANCSNSSQSKPAFLKPGIKHYRMHVHCSSLSRPSLRRWTCHGSTGNRLTRYASQLVQDFVDKNHITTEKLAFLKNSCWRRLSCIDKLLELESSFHQKKGSPDLPSCFTMNKTAVKVRVTAVFFFCPLHGISLDEAT